MASKTTAVHDDVLGEMPTARLQQDISLAMVAGSPNPRPTPPPPCKHTWVPQRGCGSRHDGRHQAVCLAEAGVGNVQPLGCYPVEGGVVKDHNRVRIQREPLEREQRVVGLHHHIARLGLVGEHAAWDRRDLVLIWLLLEYYLKA